jgi:hypothetical protein
LSPAAGNHDAETAPQSTVDHPTEEQRRGSLATSVAGRCPAEPPSQEATKPAAEPPPRGLASSPEDRRPPRAGRTARSRHQVAAWVRPPSLHRKERPLCVGPRSDHGLTGSEGRTTHRRGEQPTPTSNVSEPRTTMPAPVHRREEEGGHAAAFLAAAREPGGRLGRRRGGAQRGRVAAARVRGGAHRSHGGDESRARCEEWSNSRLVVTGSRSGATNLP